jgi:SpoIIAA-like
LRFLYQLGPQFDGFAAGAAWEDAKLGLRALRLLDGCALVGSVSWMQESARLVGFFMPCPVKAFGNAERDEAIAWLRSLPEGPAISHQLLADKGVLVVEIKQCSRLSGLGERGKHAPARSFRA